MADCERVPTEVIDAAMRASESIAHFYIGGGGSPMDLRTDISTVCEAVLEALAAMPAPSSARHADRMPRRITSTHSYVGPERRRRPRP